MNGGVFVEKNSRKKKSIFWIKDYKKKLVIFTEVNVGYKYANGGHCWKAWKLK